MELNVVEREGSNPTTATTTIAVIVVGHLAFTDKGGTF